MKAGTHSPFGERSHTSAYTPKQGPSLLQSQCGFVLPAKSLLFHRAFIYIHFPVLCSPHYRLKRKSQRRCHRNSVPNHSSLRFSTSRTNGPRSLSWAKVSTRSAFGERSHTAAHTPKQGRFGWGWYHYPQRALRAAETPDGRLSKRLICRFLRSGGRSSPHDSYFLANIQVSLSVISVANVFALWYDKSHKSGSFGDEGEPE